MNFKNIMIALLTVGLLAAIIFGIHYKKAYEGAQVKAVANSKTVNTAARIITRFVDSSGRNHATIAANENVVAPDWYKNGTAIKGGIVDTSAKALKIALDKIESLTQINIVSKASELKALRGMDSLKRVIFYFNDKFLKLSYRPAIAGADTADHGVFDYRYNDSINVVQYWKRSWLLASKRSYIDISPNDKRATVNGVKRLVVQQREPSFGLRVQAVSSYGIQSKNLVVGPGLQFDFKRMSLLGTYYYDFDLRQFRPTIGLRYDALRL